MSGKSIDKDHIRLSLSGLATEHPHGDVNYLCFTTKTLGRAKQSLQSCKTFNAVSRLRRGICKKLLLSCSSPRQASNTKSARILLIAVFLV